MGPMDNTTKCVLPQMYICCCAWNGVLQVNWNNCLFPIGNEQADEFVANVISHTNTVSNQVNKQEHRGATIVSKLTSSRGTTVIPMPNESSQSEPAISKECNGLVHILLVLRCVRKCTWNGLYMHRDAGIEVFSIPASCTRVQIISYALPVATQRKQKRCKPMQPMKYSAICSYMIHNYSKHSYIYSYRSSCTIIIPW